jgi:hypothetical protein
MHFIATPIRPTIWTAAKGTFLLGLMKNTTATSALAATALALLLFALLPVAGFAAPLDDGSNVPVAQGEAPARTCYLHAQQEWNRTMQIAPRDRRQLAASYRTFASCAKIAIVTGKIMRDGQRVPWLPEYFANTVGATYAQLQLATVSASSERCTHLRQAEDLAEQASETEGSMSTPGSPDFEQMWQALQHNVKAQSAGCGKMASR